MILAATRLEQSKNEDRTLITKTHELSDEILFDFRFRCFQLPVSEKQSTSGLRSKPEVEKLTMQKLQVNYIHPESFIPIRLVVSEEKRDQPLKKRDLSSIGSSRDPRTGRGPRTNFDQQTGHGPWIFYWQSVDPCLAQTPMEQ